MKFGIFYEHQLPRRWTERSQELKRKTAEKEAARRARGRSPLLG